MNLSLWGIFVTVAIAHFLALLSPGPDFVLIVKSAIRNGNKKSIGIAVGISVANALYISLCLIGVGSILAKSATVLVTLKVMGGLFLIYLGIQALRAKKDSYKKIALAETNNRQLETTWISEFITGFMSGLLNPKNLLFYLSLFTVVLTKEVSLSFKITLGIWMTTVVLFWDIAIIYLLSTSRVQRKFSKIAYYLDKLTGAILGMIGFTIVKSAISK